MPSLPRLPKASIPSVNFRPRLPREQLLAGGAITYGIVQALSGLIFLQDEREDLSKTGGVSRPRLVFLSLVMSGIAATIVWKLASLQGPQHQQWLQIAARQHASQITVQGARGTIYDTSGRTLAVSVPAISVGAHPHKISDPHQAALQLAHILEQDPAAIEKKLRQEKRFVWLARALPHEKKTALDALKISGVSDFDEFRRYYPQQAVASSLLGKVGTDGYGLSGLELNFNQRLTAPEVEVPVRRDAKGRLVTASIWTSGQGQNALTGGLYRTTAADNFDSVRREGGSLVLSIDAVIQDIVEREFRAGMEAAQAKDVYGLVMDADTGELLALAQSDGYDPNNPGKLRSEDLRNLVAQNSFEPGSTMKPMVVAAAMEHGLTHPSEVMDCENGRFRFGRHTIRDVHPIGTVPLAQVLVQSSNICMAKLGDRLGKERFYNTLKDFGFGTPTGVEIRGEAKGILRSPERWRHIDLATHSFGQGIAVTALQLTRAYATLANGGYLVEPTLIKRSASELPPRRRVLSEENANWVAQALKGVTESANGTGKRAKITGVSVYGKTGTAQKARVDGRGYDPDRVLASFIGFVDAGELGINRKLVMLVLVDEPGVKPRWGGTLAGPVFRRSMERILSHLLTQDGSLQTAAAPGKRHGLG